MERTAEGLARTEAELRAEKAAALARIASTLEGNTPPEPLPSPS